MNRFAIVVLRILVVVIGAGALLVQAALLFPVAANELAQEQNSTILPLPVALLGIVLALCLEVALVAIWVLLAMVKREAIFTRSAFRWVDLIIVSGGVATLLALAALFPLAGVAMRADAPGLLAISVGAVIAGTTFVLLMVVMRQLLRHATEIQTELGAVI